MIKELQQEYYEVEKNFPAYSFLQSYLWGEVEKKLQREVFRVGILENNQFIGICQIIGVKAKRGNFLKIEHGPLVKEKERFWEILQIILDWITKNDLQKKYHYLRITPGIEYSQSNFQKIKSLKFTLAPRWLTTEVFWIKEINQPEEKLLQEMTKSHKTMVLESLQKPYIEIEKSTNVESFWKIYQELSKRKHFVPYPYELIKNEFEIFHQNNQADIYFGKMEGKIYSAALIIYDQKCAYYHHAASLPTKEPINYKLHWQIILDAKKRGCQFYNFWGTMPRSYLQDIPKNHPWQGFARFKKGFGGKLIKLLPTCDQPFSMRYYLVKIYEKLKQKNFI